MMTRNNCKQVQISSMNQASLNTNEQAQQAMKMLNQNECLNAENFQYECEFTVYSEIALTTIYHPTGCGCAFTIQVVKPRPRAPDVANLLMVNAAYSTKVTNFRIIVYDIVAEKQQAEIKAFSNMALDKSTTDLIEQQVAADPDGDFSSITAGFAGTIKEFETLPPELNKNDPANKNYVPAIAFTIQQKYTTGAMFKVPCTIDMSSAPNAYMSQCQPFRANMPFAYSKRAALDFKETEQTTPDKAWFREFYLFPKMSKTCANSGYTPKARYITSFYDDVDCHAKRGFLSFDREFTSDLKSSGAVVGGWEWTRTYSDDPRVVYGAPAAFSSLQATWCLGFSQITWGSPSQFMPSTTVVSSGVCKSNPPSTTPEVQSNKYGENHPSFSATGSDCGSAFVKCPSDVTLLGFQNRNPRDFEKKPDSILLTGPRDKFCTTFSQSEKSGTSDVVTFDTLTFRGVAAGEPLAKRNWDDSAHPLPHEIHMVFDPELNALVHMRHSPLLAAELNRQLRKRGDKPIGTDPIAGAPHRDNFATNMATGSIDTKGADGASAGDHPLRRFPETYSAPLTLDPVQAQNPNEPLIYNGELVTGVPPKFCDAGDVGCICRDATAASRCDHPYECNSIGYCVRPACPFGEAGCKANTDGTCAGDDLVVTDGFCTYKTKCTLGALGCACDANKSCGTDGDCLDGVCLRKMSSTCANGEAGCQCANDGSCTGGAKCDDSGMCLFKACTAGQKGCSCLATGIKKCEDGFSCVGGNCIQTTCELGTAGCSCLAGKKCGTVGYTCVELTRDGSQTACVGQDLCPGTQTQRCLDECGAGNVAVCGKCTYSRPICRDPTVQFCNPRSYLYGVGPCPGKNGDDASSAANVVVSIIAALLAIVVML